MSLILLLSLGGWSSSVYAQSSTPTPTPTQKVADVASYATAIAPVVLDTVESIRCPDRLRCFERQGVRIGATYALVGLAKLLLPEARPCAPSACGIDSPNTSFFSGHTALAFQNLGGPRAAIVLPLAFSTGGLRVLAHKHYWWDVATGAIVGSLTSRIR